MPAHTIIPPLPRARLEKMSGGRRRSPFPNLACPPGPSRTNRFSSANTTRRQSSITFLMFALHDLKHALTWSIKRLGRTLRGPKPMCSFSCSIRCTVLNDTLTGIWFKTFLAIIRPFCAVFSRARSALSDKFRGILTLTDLFFCFLRFRYPLTHISERPIAFPIDRLE